MLEVERFIFFIKDRVINSIILLFSLGFLAFPPLAVTHNDSSDDELVLVVGASGRTGSYVIKYLKESGINFIAMTSSIERAEKKFDEEYDWVEADVKDAKRLDQIMDGVTAVISSLGTNQFEGSNGPEFVDYGGTKNLVDAAINSGTVRHYVQVSSAGVTHKEHPLNRLGNVLVWKLKAEDYIRESKLTHTIIRPGGLLDNEKGFANVKMEQGDSRMRGGMTSRGNVAAIAIESLTNKGAWNKTFEAFDNDEKLTDWREEFFQLATDNK